MVQNVQRIFSNFSIIFQFSLYMQKLTPTWALKKDKNVFFFLNILCPPKNNLKVVRMGFKYHKLITLDLIIGANDQ